jgi:prepilin-type N-terminal cleavage/methylation domain-containing protein
MKRGYTIVELLVVISILVLLIGLAAAQFARIRAGSRDARRINDINASARALDRTAEVYKGIFPPFVDGERANRPLCALGLSTGGRSYILDSLRNAQWPKDPLNREEGCTSSLNATEDYQYLAPTTGSTGTEYTLVTALERAANADEVTLVAGSTTPSGRIIYSLAGPGCVGTCR